MKKFIFSSTGLLIIGIILFGLGCIQPALYDNAKASGYEVEATVVDIDKKTEKDSDGWDTTVYVIYGDYELNGKEYKHVKIDKKYMDMHHIGEKIMVVVNPDNPGELMFEGGIVMCIGFTITVVAVVFKIKELVRKNRAKKQNMNPQ